MQICIIEDDAAIAEALGYTLEKEGYRVCTAGSVKAAFPFIGNKEIDLYIIDVMLPDGTGYDICRKIKTFHDKPVIFLTACDEEANVVMGLDLGADDYITKPFRVRELISRIQSVMRRYKNMPTETNIYRFKNISVSIKDAKVFKGEEEAALTALEYKLLLILISRKGTVITRDRLLEHVFTVTGEYVNDNTLTVYIKRLREKLEDDPGKPELIKTIRGFGYQIGE